MVVFTTRNLIRGAPMRRLRRTRRMVCGQGCLTKGGLDTGMGIELDSQTEARQICSTAAPDDRQGQRDAARPDPEQGLLVRLYISAKKRLLKVL